MCNKSITGGLIALLILGSSSAFALRCGDKLIRTGDSYYKIQTHCPVDHVYQVQNQNADINKVYMKQGGRVHEMIVVDGKLQSVSSEWE